MQSYQELTRKRGNGCGKPVYVEKRGLSSHRVARTPNSPGVLPKLSRSLSGQLTSGAAGKVLTMLERDLPEVSPFPL